MASKSNKKHSDIQSINQSPSLILAFIFPATAAPSTRLGRRLGSGRRRLLDISAHLECQVVEIGEEARSHVLVLLCDLKSVRFALVGDLEDDEGVGVAELYF